MDNYRDRTLLKQQTKFNGMKLISVQKNELSSWIKFGEHNVCNIQSQIEITDSKGFSIF
jgi:hypothetical protein